MPLKRTAYHLIHALGQRVGHRGTALLFFALVDVVYAAGMAFADASTLASPTYVFLAQLLPTPVWAAVWLAVGLVCFAQAFMRSDRVAFAAASALKVGWGLIHLVGWIAVDLPRGYLGATIWLAFAGFVHVISTWPEPGGER